MKRETKILHAGKNNYKGKRNGQFSEKLKDLSVTSTLDDSTTDLFASSTDMFVYPKRVPIFSSLSD